jgi:chromate transporter
MAKDGLQWVIFALMGVVTAWSESEILWLFLLSGVIAMVAQVPPAWLKRPASACLMVAITPDLLLQIVWFFAKAGAFVFGSGLAIVPFLHAGVVQEYGWLNDKQFLDAVAVAMLTPGPIVITVAFIGYLVAAFPGAVAAAVGVFLPVYLFVVVPFPWFDRISGNARVKGFVAGVTAAASGTIAGACVVLARRAIVDVPTLLIAAAALVVAWRFKIPEPVLIAAGALAGLIIFAVR